MNLSDTLQEILEYRGVENLVAAKIITDSHGTNRDMFATGPVFAIAGVATITKAAGSNAEVHYYNNQAAVAVEGKAPDTITINVSAIPLEVEAEITGQKYDEVTGAMYEGKPEKSYYALGYATKKTNGDKVLVWRLKGLFSTPDQTSSTEDAGTGANGQTLIYTGISTAAHFARNDGKPATAVVVDASKGLINDGAFFNGVVTPDGLRNLLRSGHLLRITEAANTTVTVVRDGVEISAIDAIYDGDALTITVTGGTVTVNGSSFISGDTHNVTGNVTIVSTASA